MFPLLHRDKDSGNASVLDQMCVSSITRHRHLRLSSHPLDKTVDYQDHSSGFRYDSLTNETKTSSVSI
ncbi:hypothetical protein TUMSATVNIG2_20140 [Vibrio nigripulchritudo]|nr:hypothetical protein TUMSATVNIG2_20140 [Vibrio nigripulchritudo]